MRKVESIASRSLLEIQFCGLRKLLYFAKISANCFYTTREGLTRLPANTGVRRTHAWPPRKNNLSKWLWIKFRIYFENSSKFMFAPPPRNFNCFYNFKSCSIMLWKATTWKNKNSDDIKRNNTCLEHAIEKKFLKIFERRRQNSLYYPLRLAFIYSSEPPSNYR